MRSKNKIGGKKEKRTIPGPKNGKTGFINWKIKDKIIYSFLTVIVMYGAINYFGMVIVIKNFRNINSASHAVYDIILNQKNLELALRDYYMTDSIEDLPQIDFFAIRENFDEKINFYADLNDKKTAETVVSRLRGSNNNFLDAGANLASIHKEKLAIKTEFDNLYEEEKNQRYAIKDIVLQTKDMSLIANFNSMSYASKEALFQYRDDSHMKEWLGTIESLKSESKTDTILASKFDSYYSAALAISRSLPLFNEKSADELQKISALKESEKIMGAIQREVDDLSAKKFDNVATAAVAMAFFIVCLSLIFAIMVGYLISYFISNPIKKMANYALEISAGNLSKRVEIDSNDEIGQTAAALNAMLDKLQKARSGLDEKIKELEKFNELAVGRELKMIEMKEKIKDLKKKI